MSKGKTKKQLEKTISILEEELASCKKELEDLHNRYNNLLRSRFKKSSEESEGKQLHLFDDGELNTCLGICDETAPETPITEQKVNGYIRRKSTNTTLTLPPDTPVIHRYIDVEPGKCEHCGADMVKVGEKTYDSIVKTTTFAMIRTHVPQFECPRCIPEDEKETRIKTPVTDNMLQGTICDPMLLANIINNKMGLGLPLYRQEQIFKLGNDLKISRQVMSAWMMKTGRELLKYLYPALQREINKYPLVNMDETPVKVLELYDEDGKKKAPNSRANAFMIVRAGTDSQGKKRLVCFTYSDNRRNETIASYVADYHGCLQTDGLSGYDYATSKSDFVHLGCLVHSRRKAIEAKPSKGTVMSRYADQLVELYGRIFKAEGDLLDAYRANGFESDDEYVEKRKEALLPLFNDLHAKLVEIQPKVLPKSKLYVAVTYPLERWDTLLKFLDYPYATSSNQTAENAIRPFAVARKAFLFCITPLGAEVSALFFSLVESCKAQGIDAEDYLTYLFSHAGNVPADDEDAWTALLPGKVDLSEVKAFRDKVRKAIPDPDRTEPYILRGKR